MDTKLGNGQFGLTELIKYFYLYLLEIFILQEERLSVLAFEQFI